MLPLKQLFFEHIAQTSYNPIAIEVKNAHGIYIYDTNDNKYIDLISGIAVSNIGHCHPEIIKAIKDQLGKHMHAQSFNIVPY